MPEIGNSSILSRSSPVQIPGTTWKKLSDGYQHLSSYASRTDDTLWAWGFNDIGQLGQSDLVHRSSPVQIPGTTWKCIYTGSGKVVASKKL